MTPEQIKAERKAFEKDRRRIGWDASSLRRHIFRKTWFGEKDLMPNYLESWTEAQWLGYLARAERATAALGAVVADAEQDESGWLIEFNADGNALWWDGTFKPIGDHWDERRNRLGANMVNRANAAVRFANRESAQKVLDGLLAMRPFSVLANAAELYSVTEHLWPAPAAAIDTGGV